MYKVFKWVNKKISLNVCNCGYISVTLPSRQICAQLFVVILYLLQNTGFIPYWRHYHARFHLPGAGK